MQDAYQLENELMAKAIAELKARRRLSPRMKEILREKFGERFTNGWELAASRKVKRLEFEPSKRIIWVVQGRKSEYQVIPDIPFCYCDDYYFRVMDKKRGFCYHIIAQKIAEAMDEFEAVSAKDSEYHSVTYRWRAKEKEE